MYLLFLFSTSLLWGWLWGVDGVEGWGGGGCRQHPQKHPSIGYSHKWNKFQRGRILYLGLVYGPYFKYNCGRINYFHPTLHPPAVKTVTGVLCFTQLYFYIPFCDTFLHVNYISMKCNYLVFITNFVWYNFVLYPSLLASIFI